MSNHGLQFMERHTAYCVAAINNGETSVRIQPELLAILLEDCGKMLALTGHNERLIEGIAEAEDSLRQIRKDCLTNRWHVDGQGRDVFVLLESQLSEPHRTLKGLLEDDK